MKPVARFYAGDLSEDDVLKAAEDEAPVREKEKKCEAYYYLGMAHLLGVGATRVVAQEEGAYTGAPLPERKEKAKEYFEKCLATGVKEFTEYDRAKWELEQLEESR